jgi:tryptophan synthase alpha chain
VSNIKAVFESKRKVLIAYVTVGYPDIETSLKVVPILIENGCDLIELGIPFSDPLADGVTIQKASHQALQNGVSVGVCLEVAGKLNSKHSINLNEKRVGKTPLVFMTYYNPVLNYGLEKFFADCSDNGVSGLIIPDLPPEESSELESYASRNKVDVIYLLAPNSTDDRIKLVAERSKGFIYLVSLTGVTGTRDAKPTDLEEFVKKVRNFASQPLSVGFGVSTAKQASQIAKLSDGVIIGSKIIQLIESDPSLKSVVSFIRDVRGALDAIE